MGENIRVKDEKYSSTDGNALVIQPASTGFTIEQLLSYPGNTNSNYFDESDRQVEYAPPCPMYEIEKAHLSPTEFAVTGYPDANQNNLLQPYQEVYYHEDSEPILKQPDTDISSQKRSWQSAFGRGYASTRTETESSMATEDGQGSQDTMFEIVVKAIMSARGGEILLSEIYNYIVTNYAKFRDAARDSWRVTVRHALSVNSCFIKGKKAKNGRGFYWKIHPACLEMFSNSDLDRKKAAKLVQQTSSGHNKRSMTSSTNGSSSTDGGVRQHLSPVVHAPGHNADHPLHDELTINEHMDHVRHYVPMTTIPLMSYTYYELLVNLCDIRDQQ